MASEDATPDPLSTSSTSLASSSINSILGPESSTQVESSTAETLLAASADDVDPFRPGGLTLFELEQLVITALGRPLPHLDEEWRNELKHTVETSVITQIGWDHPDVKCGLTRALDVYLEEKPDAGAIRSYIRNLKNICQAMEQTYWMMKWCKEDLRRVGQMRLGFEALQAKLLLAEREIGERGGNRTQRRHDMELLPSIDGGTEARGRRGPDRHERTKQYAGWACYLLSEDMDRIKMRIARLVSEKPELAS